MMANESRRNRRAAVVTLKAIVVLASVAATTQPAAAQGHVHEIDLYAAGHAVLRLAPGTPEAAATFTVDVANQLIITISSTAQGLETILEVPGGQSYAGAAVETIGGSFGEFAGAEVPEAPFISDSSLPGYHYAYTLPSQGPGTYRVTTRLLGITQDEAVVIQFLSDSAIRANLLLSERRVTPGTPVVVTAMLYDGAAPVAGASVQLTSVAPNGDVSTTALLDDGEGPNAAAGDGLYSGTVSGTMAGMYAIVADLTGTSAGGHAFARSTGSFLEVVAASGAFSGIASGVPDVFTLFDFGEDTNGNGKYERLIIGARIDVAVNGTYGLRVVLRTQGGQTMEMTDTANLAAGPGTIGSRFEATVIRATNENGPYTIETAELIYYGAGGPVSLDLLANGTKRTRWYCLGEFEGPPGQTGGSVVVYVDKNVVGGRNDGASWDNAFTDLQSALAITSSCNVVEVWVAEGTYKPSLPTDPNDPRTATFRVPSGWSLYGGFSGTETQRDQRRPGTYRTVLSGDLGGNDAQSPANPPISDNAYHVVTGNNTDASTILDGFFIVAGHAGHTGGGTDSDGGGLFVRPGSMQVRNCSFLGNRAFMRGGAALVENGSPSFVNCVFSGNSGSLYGGALAVVRANVAITNCTFHGNAVALSGGKGGAIGAQQFQGTTNLSIRNSIFWGNVAQSFNGPQIAQVPPENGSSGNTISVDYSIVEGGAGQISIPTGDNLAWGTANLDEDPRLVNPVGNDWIVGTMDDDLRLKTCSPAIDAADATPLIALGITMDLDGEGRYADNPCAANSGVGLDGVLDRGAYEERVTDCNGNLVFDCEDIISGSSLDCNGTCVPDECDIASGRSADVDTNGVPDECEGAPVAPPFPHNVKKNRYVSFAPTSGTAPAAFRIDKVTPPTGSRWVGNPDGNAIALAQATRVDRVWTEPVVHVGDCEIVPDAQYEIRTTFDSGQTFSPPIVLRTIEQPCCGKHWGDTVGAFNGFLWTPPNGIVNANDFLAALQKFQSLPQAPPLIWVDVQSVSSADPCLNRLTNFADVFVLIQAFQGNTYPFTTNPATCPPCGGQGSPPPEGGEGFGGDGFVAGMGGGGFFGPESSGVALTVAVSPFQIDAEELATVKVYVDSVLDLAAFETALLVTPAEGATGALTLEAITVDTADTDFVFYGHSVVSGANDSTGNAGAARMAGTGYNVTGPKYLATYQYRASAGAEGVWEVTTDESAYLLDGDALLIESSAGNVAFIRVGLDCTAPAHCADANPCTDDVCDAGECSNPNSSSSTPCDDGLFCTATDLCDGNGACTSTGDPCTKLSHCCENLDQCVPNGQDCWVYEQ